MLLLLLSSSSSLFGKLVTASLRSMKRKYSYNVDKCLHLLVTSEFNYLVECECVTKAATKLKYLFIYFLVVQGTDGETTLYLNLLKVNELKNKGSGTQKCSERDVVLSTETKRITYSRKLTEKEAFKKRKREKSENDNLFN